MSDLYTWVSCINGEIPATAVVGGHDSGMTLYVGRTAKFGDVLPGKILPEHQTCYVSYGGEEHAASEYEALVIADHAIFEWVSASNGEVPEGAVEGGNTENGEKLYVGRAPHEDTLTCGKIHPSNSSLFVPYGGTEHAYQNYEVLVCKPVG